MRKIIEKHIRNAYKVYSKQKVSAVIMNNSIYKIIVYDSFFKKLSLNHSEIENIQIFDFVKTLYLPDEIYQRPDEKLNFFRYISDIRLHIVSIGKDKYLNQFNVVTSFYVNLSSKNKRNYIQKLKKTSKVVFFRTPGRTLHFPSSNIL